MKAEMQIKIGNYSAIAAIVVILLALPSFWLFLVCYDSGSSLREIMEEPEDRGWTLLYLVITYCAHVPLICLLAIFPYVVKRCAFKTLLIFFVILLVGLILSGIYFYLTTPKRHLSAWTPAISMVVYVAVVTFLLSQSILGRSKKIRLESRN